MKRTDQKDGENARIIESSDEEGEAENNAEINKEVELVKSEEKE